VPYTIEYSPEAIDHLKALTARQQAIVIDAIEEQLAYQPMVETRNRKPMRPNPVAPWELRVGTMRAYYDVAEQPEQTVFIRAIGVKQRNRVTIGGEEIEL
jgi:mRNA-degrading endonuclease RelE of RelBE toxin-antitoxin system